MKMGNSQCLLKMRQQLVSAEPWASKIGMNEVLLMKELNDRAPDLMRKCVVVVDVVRDSPESVVNALTGCFASAADGMPELGLGSAEYDVVLNAWKLYCCLVANAKVMRRWADWFYVISTLLVLVAALTSVLTGVIAEEDDPNQ